MTKRRARRGRSMDIVGAGKKLRQAVFFLELLDQAPRDMPQSGRNPEHLEFLFSACLSAAQSVYYVLDETGGHEIQERWRDRLPQPQRSQFGRMIGLRGDDVHLALTGAEPLPKYVETDATREGHYIYHRRSASYDSPKVEMENPDGTKVSGHGLRGTIGLYIQRQGRRIEATDACRGFIEQLSSLLDEMRTHARKSTE